MTDGPDQAEIARVRDLLGAARHVACLTGAGISAASGVPTYRGAHTGRTVGGALWDGLRVEDWATPAGYARDPQRVWKWYSDRRVQLGELAPNAGHVALAELEKRLTARGGAFTLATQNIDALHQRAGSVNVLALHGSLLRIRCSVCPYRREVGHEPIAAIPACPDCGARLRPDVVWFGEMLPQDVWTAAADAAGDCDVFLTAGTSAVVYPAAGLVEIAAATGATTVEVNLEPTPASSLVDVALQGPADELLPQLVA
ncbi:MAG: NAD-dependent deacylase [Phycisphaerae bacterium]|nr:NAD-dependent deacylase [Phycisphaerae bacterium]